jgi:HD-GYP domain-containing protein (c-di-GMP phosphodiesterase class II)
MPDPFDAVLAARPYRGSTCASTRARDMNATVDALTDLEHRLTEALSDALSKAECARLEFEARLATALAAEIADLMTQANARRPASLPSAAESPGRRSWWPWRRAG